MALEVGVIVEGEITGVKKFGAFVALPEGKTGMVHISEVSSEFIQDLDTVLQEGQKVKVKVINVAPDGKIALSIKRTQPRPERPAGAPRQGGTSFQGGAPRQGGASFHGGAPRQGGAPRPAGGRPGGRAPRNDAPRVWQPKQQAMPQGDLSFEDMMSRYKSRSEEKIADLKRVTENRRGGGYSRKKG